jgi:hypothetical protein
MVPASVDDRAVPGHWEGDLLSRDTQAVVSALIKQAKKLPTNATNR